MGNSVDILIHVHPVLDLDDQARLKEAVLGEVGVLSADFDPHTPPHALQVVYKPDVVNSSQILAVVRRHDPVATMVGL